MSNLIENAIKYSPDGEPPEVKLIFGDELEIRIKDHGIGIPEEELPKLFETFFRASNVDNIQGTGLGLSIAKSLVELQGGVFEISIDGDLFKAVVKLKKGQI